MSRFQLDTQAIPVSTPQIEKLPLDQTPRDAETDTTSRTAKRNLFASPGKAQTTLGKMGEHIPVTPRSEEKEVKGEGASADGAHGEDKADKADEDQAHKEPPAEEAKEEPAAEPPKPIPAAKDPPARGGKARKRRGKGRRD
mmetsp:Transcript_11689/g.24923  ORF Transcript_11689/g.24923 Transcript_11689/m.24923 type:complete len:141 (+) Transcript_11689:1447-1869(+)